MLAKLISGTIVGLDAIPIEVEIDVSTRGLPTLSIVGLPDKAVQEAKERVRSAIINTGTLMPNHRVTINLAPADIPKQGPAFDLPIALGILLANQDITVDIPHAIFVGEVSLDGSLRHTHGILPITLMAKKSGFTHIFLPQSNAHEAAIVSGINIIPIQSIKQLVNHLKNIQVIDNANSIDINKLLINSPADIDLSDIYGQEHAKRALEIAAAGGHNLHLTGTPGSGKTMLARAFAGILPTLTPQEALDLTKIYSISGNLNPGQAIITSRPFRNPHHTTSKIGLIGGGSNPKPGEISLAHRGVLFLDEFPEFPRSLIESLRQPMEDGTVHIARAAQTTSYPCRFTLIAASNPCPCGNYQSDKPCTCSTNQINRYQQRISGPMLDRIDLHLFVPQVNIRKLTQKDHHATPSKVIQEKVQKARRLQSLRFKNTAITCNGEMSTKAVKKYCLMSDQTRQFLTQATIKLNLSARSYFKTIKIARTIADLEAAQTITTKHIAESLQFRPHNLS